MIVTNNRHILILGILLLLSSINVCLGQTKAAEVEALITQYHTQAHFNGSALIATNGKVIYKGGAGMANMEWDIPNRADTKHRLGSITKQFTAMLILQLVAEGAIELEKPITTYLPDYPAATGGRITIHHLLTHTSGIPNYTAFPDFFAEQSRDPYTPTEFVQEFADKELDFTPGEKFNYSNSGYFLLGVLLEELSGKSYEELLREKIFAPLRMEDTGYDNHQAILKKRATGYEREGMGYSTAAYLDMSIPYAAGSMYSTVEDLLIWDQALYTDKLLPEELMERYFQPATEAFGDSHYAYGWMIGEENIGNTEEQLATISHGGGINGFNTYISRATEDRSLVVLLNNTGGAPLGEMTQAIRGILYDQPYDLPKKSVAMAVKGKLQAEGIEAGIAQYQAVKDDEAYQLTEDEMNALGYELMRDGRLEEALAIFELNVAEFPDAFNVHDSYAEVLMKLGQTDASIAAYKKSVSLNPANQNGLDMLAKLGADTASLVKVVEVPEELLTAYVGEYELTQAFVITITKEGSQLKAQATGQPAFEIYPKSDTQFYLKAVEAQVTFNADADGEIESLTLFQAGREMVAKKL